MPNSVTLRLQLTPTARAVAWMSFDGRQVPFPHPDPPPGPRGPAPASRIVQPGRDAAPMPPRADRRRSGRLAALPPPRLAPEGRWARPAGRRRRRGVEPDRPRACLAGPWAGDWRGPTWRAACARETRGRAVALEWRRPGRDPCRCAGRPGAGRSVSRWDRGTSCWCGWRSGRCR